AVVDIFAALLNGATLFPFNIKEDDPSKLADWLIKEEITVYHSTPTLYRYFLSTVPPETKLTKLRLLVLGGEAVNKRDADRYREHLAADSLFVNLYGSTESTISALHLMNRQTEISKNTVPICCPIADTETLLLDENGEEVGVYGVGEITIKSRHSALGYWRNPDLTRAVFRPDPGDARRQ